MQNEEGSPTGSWKRSYAVALLIVLLIVLFFYRTVFYGEPISRLDLLVQWDSLYDGMKSGVKVGIEPSSILFLMPYAFVVAKSWLTGVIPLWNQYSALGCPLLADPESSVFAPWTMLLALSPTFKTYNLLLVVKLAVAALGTFFFARRLGLGLSASALAALTLAFCPYIQWYMELIGSGYCLIPLLFYAFTDMVEDPGCPRSRAAQKAVVAGTVCAVFILSGHIEISFCSIFIVSLWTLLLAFSRGGAKALRPAFLQLVLAGFSAFLVAAPMLLPFIEFLLHCDSYKFGFGNPSRMSPVGFLLSLLQPGYGGASIYLGVVALAFLPFALFYRRPEEKVIPLSVCLAGLAFFVFGLACRLPLFGLIYLVKPFSFIVATYFLPVLILLLAVLAAYGFDWALGAIHRRPYAIAAVVTLISTAAILTRPLCQAFKVPIYKFVFDQTLPSMAFSRNDWYLVLCISLVVIAFLFATIRFRKIPPGLVATALVGAGFLSQSLLAEPALPVRTSFHLPDSKILDAVKRSEGRLIGTGDHLLKANTNLFYEIRDLRMLNAVFPSRYLKFVEEAGARITSFDVSFQSPLSSLLSLASVSKVLTKNPVFVGDVSAAVAVKPLDLPVLKLSDSASIDKVEYAFRPDDRAVFARLEPRGSSEDFLYVAFLESSKGNVVSLTDPLSLAANECRTGFGLAVPKSLDPGGEVYLRLRVLNKADLHPVIIDGLPGREDFSCQLKSQVIEPPSSPAKDCDFRLLEEDEHGLRLYESLKSVPEAYFVHNVKIVEDDKAAIAALKSSQFDAWREVILERGEPGVTEVEQLLAFGAENSYQKIVPQKVSRPNANQIEMLADLNKPSLLVLTDIFYPGWKARIDNREVAIMHVNFLFRGITVPAGEHRIQFEYSPGSFKLGVGCFFFYILAVLTLGFCRIRQWRRL
ncbi:MAG: YfhO family protein [Cyanobacteria bacterium HKST-UBA01]|nr:YfhO family protein [Cyanobacteria bacterium HKST-UBA01]